MGFPQMIISFVALMAVVAGWVIFGLRMAFISNTEGAIKRLNDEIAKEST